MLDIVAELGLISCSWQASPRCMAFIDAPLPGMPTVLDASGSTRTYLSSVSHAVKVGVLETVVYEVQSAYMLYSDLHISFCQR